jgi:type I restriction enzyme R subunit
MSPTPEQRARLNIDAALEAAGWLIQDRAAMNLSAGQGVAVREFRLAAGHGFADYLLFVDGKAVGVVEAKPAGYALTNVELQADKYATGLPAGLNPPVNPLPFLYLGTGVETRFINGLDPDPKTRAIAANLPHIHRPATLAEWIAAETLDTWVKRLHAEGGGLYTAAIYRLIKFGGARRVLFLLDRSNL